MNAPMLSALAVAVCVSAAGAGEIQIDLHFADGSYSKTLYPGETTWIELSFQVTGGALLCANVPWDIVETHANAFSILDKEIPEGWYDLLSDNGEPTVFPSLSGGLHGYYTGEASGWLPLPTSGVLERYLIRGEHAYTGWDLISVVDYNPLKPPQTLSLYGEFDELTLVPGGHRSIELFTLVPEPASFALLGLTGLVMLRRR